MLLQNADTFKFKGANSASGSVDDFDMSLKLLGVDEAEGAVLTLDRSWFGFLLLVGVWIVRIFKER